MPATKVKPSPPVQSKSVNAFGLPPRTLNEMLNLLSGFEKIDTAVIYGSRAMGNYHAGSDIDIALIGDALNLQDLERIAGALDESAIPYKVDLSILKLIDHPELRDHIARVGKVLYEKR